MELSDLNIPWLEFDAQGDRRGAAPRRMLEIQSGVPENLQTGAPSGPFVSGHTHKSSLLRTASSRSPDHPIATR
jgi:hypothetical protein